MHTATAKASAAAEAARADAGGIAGAALIEAMMHAVWVVDAVNLRIVAANRAAAVLLGAPATGLVGRDMLALAATPEDLCFWNDVAAGVEQELVSDTWVRRDDGVLAPVTRRVSAVRGAGGQALFVVALHDRGERVRVEHQLEDAVADLQATLESTADGILVTDLDGHIRSFNQRFTQLWGMPAELLQHRNDDAVLDWMRAAVVDASGYMRRLVEFDGGSDLEACDELRLHSGTVMERVTRPLRRRGHNAGRVYSFRDITERLEASRRIEVLSHTDALTGLPNRLLLADRIERALAGGRRDGSCFAVLHLDLDRFKPINDTLGHAQGDRVLVDVAARLKSCMREVDTVARPGADEFVLLAQGNDAAGAEATARRVLEALRAPFTQGGLSFTVTASIGIALYPNDGMAADELLSGADAAMHAAKAAGRDTFNFHQPRHGPGDDELRARMRLDHAMRQALAQKRFALHYQPQVDVRSGAVRGAEALIRWNDPERGAVPPGAFIPVAEESGFIVAIGHWVLCEAVRQAAAWRAQGLDLIMSVNVSALQFQQPGFVHTVAQALAEAGLPGASLELELTESILVQDVQATLRRLNEIAALGVQLAIDDFGTGYSSLSYLKRLPIARLKIDRSFVSGLPGDESDAGIVNAIIHMGRALRLQIVAEGVETAAQRQFLAGAGCEQYQGFLCSPALPAADFEALLAAAQAPTNVLRLR
jgi:diguanylate cyclase (GGDEF)-like protein/PAS domain S-box-containing protein